MYIPSDMHDNKASEDVAINKIIRKYQISNWEVLAYNWTLGPSNLVQKSTRIWTNLPL